MGGIHLDQPLPSRDVSQIDPFILLHHWKERFPGNQDASTMGVGPHPHRGFMPVTFVFEGSIRHRDSLGNDAEVRAGGAQWMHAGKGIIHSERPTQQFASKGGDLEVIQLWVNAPAEEKLTEPFYQPLQIRDIPVIEMDNKKVLIYNFAGIFEATTGPAKTLSDLCLLRLDIGKGGKVKLSFSESQNLAIYQLDGETVINDTGDGKAGTLYLFNNQNNEIEITGSDESRLLIMSGVPLNEPIATGGPFVMNTTGEIKKAFLDYQHGLMGHLRE